MDVARNNANPRGTRHVLILLCVVAAGCGGRTAPAPAGASPSPAASASTQLILTCGAQGAEFSHGVVQAQPEGVHVSISNPLPRNPGVTFRFADGNGLGENAPPGKTNAVVLQAPPGRLQAGCGFDPQMQANAEVVDPQGLYVDGQLGCDAAVASIPEYIRLPAGDPDPATAARKGLEFGMKPGDDLRRAGYPQSDQPVYVVIRDGMPVASTELARGRHGWYADGYDACEGY